MKQHVPVIVVQRQTLDWSALTYDTFRPLSEDFCRLWSKPADYVFRLMQLWDATFSISYFETRARLKAISSRNLSEISDITFVPYQAYRNIPDTDGFYLFMDDDDWAAPDLATVLGAQSPDMHSTLLWRAVNVGGSQQEHPVFIWGLNGRCMTNNYAVSGAWLDHLQKLDAVVQHVDAINTFAEMRGLQQLDAVLTASNKSPCSSVSLDRGLQGDLSSAKLVQMLEDYLAKMAMLAPGHLWMGQWMAPWIAETVALFREVAASRLR